MMLRSKKVLASIPEVAVPRKMSRKRKILRRSLSEVHIEGRKSKKCNRVKLHCNTDWCQASPSSDCISGVEQSSSAAEHFSISQANDNPSVEMEKCSSGVLPSNNSVPQMLASTNQTSDMQPPCVSENPVRSLDLEDSIVEVPIEISDVHVLGTKSHQLSSTNNNSTDADTSDVIVIPDSPRQGNVGIKALKNVSHEVPQLRGRKRKNTDESGVEIVCDISASRPKKQQRIERCIKEIKLGANPKIEENFTVTISDTDRKVSQLSKNLNNVNVSDITMKVIDDIINVSSGERSTGDGDDIIFIGAEDDEVSVIDIKKEHKPPLDDIIIDTKKEHKPPLDDIIIDTKKEHKPPLDDIIILDSPPAQTPVQTSDKPKKMVSASTSIAGLIPHYTHNLIDYISLDGKPPATTSGSFTGTPMSPASNRRRDVTHKHIPVLNKPWNSKSVRNRQKYRAALKNRLLNAHNRDPSVETNFVPLFTFPPPPYALAANEISTDRNANENSVNQYSTAQYSTAQYSSAQSSSAQSSSAQSSSAQNSSDQNSASDNSVQSAPEVSQSPACAYGTNMYNPNASKKEEYGLRPIIIDGNNIAMGHGKGKCFSWRGLHICIKYFLKRGHDVTAFVPTFRRGNCPPELRDVLEQYERSGQVVFTPSRRIDGRLIVPYDDRFIVQCAAELGGVIVSTDNYRDLLTENSSWKETIEKRLLMFTWVGDILMFPNDPLGRYGPKLEEFLRFPKAL